MSIAKKAISGALWMSGINYIGFAVNFGIQLVLVRLLVPEDFGLFVLGLSIAQILFIFFSFSFSMAVIQIREAEDLFDTAFYLSLGTGLVILIVGGGMSWVLTPYYPVQSVTAFIILCGVQPLMACASIYSASMEKELSFKRNAIVRGVSTNLSGFGAITLAYLGFGVWSLVAREVITAVLMLSGMRLVSDYRFGGRFNRETARRLFEFGYKRLFARGLEIILNRVPLFLIGTFAGTYTLGLFSQAYYLAGLPNAVTAPATTYVAYPTYSKVQGDKEKMSRAFSITNYFLIRFSMPIMLVLAIYPTEVLRVLYGDKWIEASTILACFALYAAVLPLFSNVNTLLYGLGRLLDVSKIYLIAIVFLLTGIFTALYYGNIYLGALAYSATIVVALLTAYFILKREGMELSLKGLFSIPVSISLAILLFGQFFSDSLGAVFMQGRVSSLIFLMVVSVFFAALVLSCEPGRTLENFRYIREKVSGEKTA
jgi:O-antigen/teichoic acid export membrane protein